MRSLQSDVEQRGTRIFELVDNHPERLFSKAGFYQRLMALSMHDEQFKTQLFRFVAVLPSLRLFSICKNISAITMMVSIRWCVQGFVWRASFHG